MEKDIVIKILHWMMLNVMEVKQHYSNAVIMDCQYTTVITMKMLVLDVEKKERWLIQNLSVDIDAHTVLIIWMLQNGTLHWPIVHT